MSSVHRIKLLVLGLLLFPIALFAQTSTTGRIDEGPLAARPAICTPGDYYVSTDTNPVVEYKCSTGNTWTPEATGGGGGSPPGAPLNSPQCNSLGTGFKACGNNNGIMYVSTTGNDSNNGTSWDTAKLTIMAAACSLPTGNCSTTPKQAGTGSIYFTSGVLCNSNPNGGCWIAGPGDSQYPNMTGSTSGPSAWTIELNNPYPTLNFICATKDTSSTNVSRPYCIVEGPNHTVGGGYLPMFWATGNSLGGFYIDGMSTGQFAGGVYSASWGRIGIDSATAEIIGTPVVTQTVGWTIDNVYNNNDTNGGLLSAGPQLAIGNGFWMHIHDSGFAGSNQEGCQVSAIARTSNVVTLTTSNCNAGGTPAQCPFLNGDHLSIRDTTGDSGLFNGTFTATSSCGATNTVTFTQTGPNFSGSVGSNGIIVDDRAFGIVCYSCQIEMARMHNSGGLKFYSGPSANLQFNDNYIEGVGAQTIPMTWISSLIYGGGGLVDISGQFQSDTPSLPAMINDGGPLVFVHTEASNSTNIRGSAVIVNGNDAGNRSAGLLASGQSGWINNQYFESNTDISRRQAPVTSSIFTNLAPQNPASWIGSNFTTASGKRDPFGGTGAIEIDATALTTAFIYDVTQSVNVGDTWYFGGWVRGASGFSTANEPFAFYLGGGNLCLGNTTQPLGVFTPFLGDGNWFWITGACTVWSTAGSAAVGFGVGLNSSTPVQVYRPFVFRVPAGTASGTEVADEINSLGFGPSTQAGAGDISFPSDKKLCLPSGSATNEFCSYLTHSNTANRTYTLPDASGTFLLGGGTTNAVTDWTSPTTLGSITGPVTGQALTALNGSAPSFASPGILEGNGGIPVTTTPYTIQCDSGTALVDRAHSLRFQSGASVVTVPSSIAAGCTGGFVVTVLNDNAGTLTFNRSATDVFSIFNGVNSADNATSFTMTNGQFATLTQGPTGIWEVRLNNSTGVQRTISPLSYGAKADVKFTYSAVFTNGSGLVTCTTGDCAFQCPAAVYPCTTVTAGCPGASCDAGKIAFGVTAPSAVNGTPGGSVLIAQTTISSVQSLTQINVGNTASAGCTPSTAVVCTFAWGTQDDAPALNSAATAAWSTPGICGALQLPAGAMFIGGPVFNVTSANLSSACGGIISTGSGADFNQTGPELYGQGPSNSVLIPLPNYNFSGCTFPSYVGILGNNPTCNGSTPNLEAHDFGVNGLGQGMASQPEAVTLWGMFGSLGGGVCSGSTLYNATFSGWGMQSAGSLGVGLGLNACGDPTYSNIVVEMFGQQNCQVTTQGTVMTMTGLACFGSTLAPIAFSSNPALGGFGGIINSYGGYYAGLMTGSGGPAVDILNTVTGSGQTQFILNSIGDFIDNQFALAGATAIQINSPGVFNFAGDNILIASGNTATSQAFYLNGTSSNTHVRNSTITAIGTNNRLIFSSSGNNFFDDGGNTFFPGTVANTLGGQFIGEAASANQVMLTAAKTVLSAGWGSTAAATAQLGGNFPVQFTITNSGTGQAASPTITYTFPTKLQVAPFTCTATQIGGTNATGTFTSSALSVTGVTFTFSLTPTASSTEIVQVTCVTP